jgi:Flp pilus assembly protein CpaB
VTPARSAVLRARPPLTLALVAAALAGCTHSVTASPRRPVTVTLMEFGLRPDSIRATVGTLTFQVQNLGRLTHNFVIEPAGQAAPVASTAPIPPGTSTTLTVTLPAGRYTIASTIQQDTALGQDGALSVVR